MTATNKARLFRISAAILLVIIATLVGFSAMADENRPKSAALVKLKVSPTAKTLALGSGKQNSGVKIQSNLASIGNQKAVFSWKSSNPKIAAVDQSGNVTPLRKGAATISLTAIVSGKKQVAKCKVTVKLVVPTSVSLSIPRSSMSVGASLTLDVSIKPADAYDRSVSFRSSNTSVVSVSSKGVVKAKKAGKAVVYVRTNSGKKVASVKVTVTRDLSGGQYRVIAVGQSNYAGDNKLPGCKKDVAMIAAAYKNATFSGKKANVHAYTNLTGAQLRNLLSDMGKMGATSADTTVFYYSGHGMSGGNMNGALCGVDWSLISVNDVQKYLDRVPGRVVVMLDCCLSGQYISSKDGTYIIGSDNSESGDSALADEFNAAVVRAFEGASVAKALTDSSQRAKYKIITASAPRQASYISNDRNDGCSVFTDYLAQALGEDYAKGKVSPQADANGDALVSLAEMYAYVSKRVNAYCARYPAYRQTTMVWPSGDATAVLARN